MSVIQDISFDFKFLVSHVASVAKLRFDDDKRVYGVQPVDNLQLWFNLLFGLMHIPFFSI